MLLTDRLPGAKSPGLANMVTSVVEKGSNVLETLELRLRKTLTIERWTGSRSADSIQVASGGRRIQSGRRKIVDGQFGAGSQQLTARRPESSSWRNSFEMTRWSVYGHPARRQRAGRQRRTVAVGLWLFPESLFFRQLVQRYLDESGFEDEDDPLQSHNNLQEV